MLTKSIFYEYLEVKEALKSLENKVFERCEEIIRKLNWDHSIDIQNIDIEDNSIIVYFSYSFRGYDNNESFRFPIEYLWTENYYEIEQKKREEENKKKSEKEQEDIRKKELEKEKKAYALYLELKEKYEKKG